MRMDDAESTSAVLERTISGRDDLAAAAVVEDDSAGKEAVGEGGTTAPLYVPLLANTAAAA
jgi:hypothetical protein